MPLNERRAGLCGGTLTGLIPLIGTDELFRTIILAFAGAIVSFLVSYFLKRIMYRRGQCFRLSMTRRIGNREQPDP